MKIFHKSRHTFEKKVKSEMYPYAIMYNICGNLFLGSTRHILFHWTHKNRSKIITVSKHQYLPKINFVSQTLEYRL